MVYRGARDAEITIHREFMYHDRPYGFTSSLGRAPEL